MGIFIKLLGIGSDPQDWRIEDERPEQKFVEEEDFWVPGGWATKMNDEFNEWIGK